MNRVDTIPVRDGLVLRATRPDDISPMWELIDRNRVDLARWFPWVQSATPDSTRAFLEDQIERHARGVVAAYGIWSAGRLAGAIALRDIESVTEANVGYYLGAHARGRGLMAASLRALADVGFASFDVLRIELVAALANLESRKVAERAGFRFEGIARERIVARDRRHDAAVYARLATDP